MADYEFGEGTMLPIHDFSGTEIHKVRTPFPCIFSPHLVGSDPLLKVLRPVRAKNAFRHKAKRYHTDLHGYEPQDIVEKQNEPFIKISEESVKNKTERSDHAQRSDCR